ncbi:HAD family hydrolase [Homoserinibacter sp. YIM 151385]|uniref:HAD family hydrolase n=1 Tax=Homoserinibacter sp. YIM 151385 TaxID=2985506 RepID=UPI0022F12E39|nr:HAD family phosphatase [Homoserinibacter sp. YIM 151385]WBU38233.1 HAD family phosphatase [Homoserinibacter sp. YIM 151385]
MSISIPGRVVVFDYGEVISRSPDEHDRARLEAVAGIDEAGRDAFWSAYWARREPLDHGRVTVPEYWAQVAADLGTAFRAAKVHELWVADFRGWISVEPGTLDLLEELREGGTRMALLSNAGFDFGDPFRRSPMGSYFERVFVSAEMGLVKPDPEIYRVTARELGVELPEMVFVDNKAENVDAAVALGVRGHVFTSPEGLRGFLEELAA